MGNIQYREAYLESVEHLRWSFLAKIVNRSYPKMLYHKYSTGFKIRLEHNKIISVLKMMVIDSKSTTN